MTSVRRLARSIRIHHILQIFPHLFSPLSWVHTYRQNAVGTWLVFVSYAVLTQECEILVRIEGFSEDVVELDELRKSAVASNCTPSALQRELVNV